MDIMYTRDPKRPSQTRDIDEFMSIARDAVKGPANFTAKAVLLELQPGDGSRYRLCVTRVGRTAFVCMTYPEFCVVELETDGPRPTVYDTPMSKLRPHAAAIFSDVVSEVVFGIKDRAYCYEGDDPCPFSVKQGRKEETG